MQGRVSNETAGRSVVGVPVLPIARQHQFRTMPPNKARDPLAVLYGINDSAIRDAEIFTKEGTHRKCCFLRFFIAFLTRTSRSHFASREIHNTEGRTRGF